MAAAAPPQKTGNVLTRKIGPLPAWVWISVIAIVILLWAWYEHSKSSSSAASGSSASTTPPEQGGTGDDSQLESEVSQLQTEETATQTEAASAQTANTAQASQIKSLQKNAKHQGKRLGGQEKQIMRRKVAPGKGIGRKKTPVEHHSRTHKAG